ncbi:hypothetical protein Hanom_Chr09g00845251 [Helianthus anomalus]
MHCYFVVAPEPDCSERGRSKLQNSSFMYITYCKLCPLYSLITENVLDVCKPLQVMSFNP